MGREEKPDHVVPLDEATKHLVAADAAKLGMSEVELVRRAIEQQHARRFQSRAGRRRGRSAGWGLYQRPDSANWHAYVMVGGGRFRISTRTSDRDVAKKIAQAWAAEKLAKHSPNRAYLPHTLDDAWPLYVKYMKHERNNPPSEGIRKRLTTFFGARPIVEIDTAMIQAYINTRVDAGKATKTVAVELAVFKGILKSALKANWLSELPRYPEYEIVDNVREVTINRQEFKALLPHLPAYMVNLVKTGYVLGWRARELTEMRWSQVDFDRGVVRLPQVANKKARVPREVRFSFHPWLLAIFQTQLAEAKALEERTGCPVDWVFHREGQQITDHLRPFKAACERAGLVGKVFHDLRRAAATNLLEAGVPDREAMRILGHKTLAMLQRYQIVADKDHSGAMTVLGSFHADIDSGPSDTMRQDGNDTNPPRSEPEPDDRKP